MFEPLTLSVSELADRWKMTPRQIIDFAGQPFLPLYFDFDGLAFDELDWLRSGGDQDQRKELENLRTDISKNEAWIIRSARGETGDYDHLSSKDAQELRQRIEANKRKCADLVELLEQREVDRKGQHYRGNMRIMPQTLDEIRRTGEAYEPWRALHPQSPVKSAMLPGRGLGGTYPISDGRIMVLEAFKPRTLTIDSLYAATAEVKAIEAWKKAKETPQPAPIEQADIQPQAGNDVPVREAPANEPQAKRRTLWNVVTPYIVETIQAGQYASAKQLFNALELKAGPDSPFEKGAGSNRGSLFVREISQSMSLKTLQTNWPKLKSAAKK